MVRGRVTMMACALAVGLTLGSAPAFAHPAVDTHPKTKCPHKFKRLSVAYLELQGPYRLPRQLDEAGNNNGYVCGQALSEEERQEICGPDCPVPVIYFFGEDDCSKRKEC